MNIHRRWLKLTLLGFLILLPNVCGAQTYQGPSGGYGGTPFDNWTASKEATDIASVSLLMDNSVIRCILVWYRDPSTGRNTTLVKSGSACRLAEEPGPLSFNCCPGITLARDEYIIGIAGRYGGRIDSIRFYTNKRSPAGFGGSGGSVQFGYTAPPGQKIVAFFGRAGDNLDAVGVMYGPIR
jgi:hypothetical protein